VKNLSLLFIIIASTVFAQYDVQITVEDPYTFLPVKNSYIRVGSGDEVKYYKSFSDGSVLLSLEGDIQIEVAAEKYRPIKSFFHIDSTMQITFLLEPEKEFMPASKPGVFLESYIFDESTHHAIKKGKITVFANEYSFSLPFQDGKFTLNRKNTPQWWSRLPEETEVTYYIEADGYKTYIETDLIPQVYTVKAFRLKPKQSHAKRKTYARELKQIPPKILNFFRQINPQRPSDQTACDRLPSTIRVGTNCTCNDCSSVQVMTLQTYVKKGLNDEWIASWHIESLKAGSLPYRTYGAYYVNHPIDSNYDISNTTCKQVWDSDYSTRCDTAAVATAGQYLETAGGAIAFSEYSAENNCLNPSSSYPCNCGDGYSGNGDNWPCIEDQVCAGHNRYGHGRGMCQWGSSRWANNGQVYTWIANHYYNPGNIYRCGTNHPHPDFHVTDASLNQASGNPGDHISATCKVENPTSYRSDKNKIALYLSSDNQLDASDNLLVSATLWPIDGNDLVTKNLSFQVPQVSDGNYYILFVADPDNTMYEQDETNNLAAVSFAIGGVGIEENEFSRNLMVYPNPAEDMLYVEAANGYEIKSIEIHDITGRRISRFPGRQRALNLENLKPGLYIFNFSDINGLKAVRKILKH